MSKNETNVPRIYTQENQALDEIAKEAEVRLAAKRAARLEAREMRKREITRQNSLKKTHQQNQNAFGNNCESSPNSHNHNFNDTCSTSNHQHSGMPYDTNIEINSRQHHQQNSNFDTTQNNSPINRSRQRIPQISISHASSSPPLSHENYDQHKYETSFINYNNSSPNNHQNGVQNYSCQPLTGTETYEYNNNTAFAMNTNNTTNGDHQNYNNHNADMYGVSADDNQLDECVADESLIENNEEYYDNNNGDDETEENVDNISSLGSTSYAELQNIDPDLLIQRIRELDSKYKASMLTNAQLHNEIDAYKYQIDNYKDDSDDLELQIHLLTRDNKREHGELIVLRKQFESTNEELKRAKEQIQKRDQLILNSNMVIVDIDDDEEEQESDKFEIPDYKLNGHTPVNNSRPFNNNNNSNKSKKTPYRSSMLLPRSNSQKSPLPTTDELDNANILSSKINPLTSSNSKLHIQPKGLSWTPHQIILSQEALKLLRNFATEELTKHDTPESLDSSLKKLLNTRRELESHIEELKAELVTIKAANRNLSQLTKNPLHLVNNSNSYNSLISINACNGKDHPMSDEIYYEDLSIRSNVSNPPPINKNLNLNNPSLTALDLLTRKLSTTSLGSTTSSAHKETQTSDDANETRRKLLEFEYKTQRYEQELTTMAANLERSEANIERQVKAREAVEALESEIKTENRKLKRELRDAKQSVEELESKIGHLERRLEKMRATKMNAVLTEIS